MDERYAARDAIRALSGTPDRLWPAGVIHHGGRALVLVVLALLAHLLFPVAPVPDFPVLETGMVAEEDIIAQVGFPIYKSEAELSRERADAAATVEPVFEYSAAAADTMLARVRVFFDRMDSVLAAGGGDAAARAGVRAVLRSYTLPTTESVVELFVSARRRASLERAVEDAIRYDLPVGVASARELEETATTNIRLRRDGRNLLIARDSVLTPSRFYERAARHLEGRAVAEQTEIQRLILIRFFEPSVRLDRAATEAARERARRAVPEIKGEVLKGEKIIGAHEQVRAEELERLEAYRDHLASIGGVGEGASNFGRAAGQFLYNLALLSIFGLLLYYFRPRVYHEFRSVLLLALLVGSFMSAAALVAGSAWPTELIPIAFPALVVAALWDGRMAVNLSLILAVLLSGQTPFLGVSTLFTLVMGGAAASLGARVARRRSHTWAYIAIIAGAYVLAALALGLLRSRAAPEIMASAVWGTVNAVASALIAVGFLPLFESFTRITTDQTLLELTDMNHPLLQRLQREAAGTFAHSLNVANLAEAAARAIDANALLTRVGSYFHDIGKMLKPQYYIENQPHGRNPHDKLKPATSAAIVRGHVIDGLKLAEDAKLPGSVKAFIAEHHGTQSISFFYDRARELDPGSEPDARDFCYPGPRPRSRETAIVMLADSVESAARVLPDPTPDRIRALVDRIVESKMAQHQLDESPLTLGELSRIKEQFVVGLSGIYHQRIDYPTVREDAETSTVPATGRT
ncbi:MAG TPA: HDIG domain-containing protein [Longimicrobiales bacterium]